MGWPSSAPGYPEGSFRDEASFRSSLRLFSYTTRHPGTAQGLSCAVLLALWFCALTGTPPQEGHGLSGILMQSSSSTSFSFNGTVDCHRLLRSQCDREFFVTAQRGDSQRVSILPMLAPTGIPGTPCYGAILSGGGGLSGAAGPDLSTRQGADWDTGDSGSAELANVFSSSTVSTWYGSTSHLGTVVKRTRLLCYGCRATATALPGNQEDDVEEEEKPSSSSSRTAYSMERAKGMPAPTAEDLGEKGQGWGPFLATRGFPELQVPLVWGWFNHKAKHHKEAWTWCASCGVWVASVTWSTEKDTHTLSDEGACPHWARQRRRCL
ncbi:unnamed protein product [Symbiodinium sp. CCMP2592]|nr:unnamed protein product [Symbiodinium sp. CCMP2592]